MRKKYSLGGHLTFSSLPGKPTVIAIVGSRNYADLQQVSQAVKMLPQTFVVATGGARGVDLTAKIVAENIGMATYTFQPLWNVYGKRAGMLRNYDIIGNADCAIVFWDGISNGTRNTIDICSYHIKIPHIVRTYDTVTPLCEYITNLLSKL